MYLIQHCFICRPSDSNLKRKPFVIAFKHVNVVMPIMMVLQAYIVV
jgi:hypothetical protein